MNNILYKFYLLGDAGGGSRHIALVELPAEIIVKILQFMNFKEISAVRRVCRRLNELCAARLNTTFQRLQSQMLVRFQTIKVNMDTFYFFIIETWTPFKRI